MRLDSRPMLDADGRALIGEFSLPKLTAALIVVRHCSGVIHQRLPLEDIVSVHFSTMLLKRYCEESVNLVDIGMSEEFGKLGDSTRTRLLFVYIYGNTSMYQFCPNAGLTYLGNVTRLNLK